MKKMIYDAPYNLEYKTALSAGLDLEAQINNAISIPIFGRVIIPTGVKANIPAGHFGIVAGRSGLNFNHGLIVPNGTIDADYRGEIKVCIYNLGSREYEILPGDSIAQLIICPLSNIGLVQGEVTNDTERGVSGFGSTGR